MSEVLLYCQDIVNVPAMNRGTLLVGKRLPPGPFSRPMPTVLRCAAARLVATRLATASLVVNLRLQGWTYRPVQGWQKCLQGYLAHKKTHPPRTLL